MLPEITSNLFHKRRMRNETIFRSLMIVYDLLAVLIISSTIYYIRSILLVTVNLCICLSLLNLNSWDYWILALRRKRLV